MSGIHQNLSYCDYCGKSEELNGDDGVTIAFYHCDECGSNVCRRFTMHGDDNICPEVSATIGYNGCCSECGL